jgi:multicomponent K+:H+ antiporter subunit C
MEWLIAIAIGAMTTAGIYLLQMRTSFSVMLGLAILSNAVNVYIFVMGRLSIYLPPIIDKTLPLDPVMLAKDYTDPLPQALVLTAIVIGFGMLAYMIVLSLRDYHESGNDLVDGVQEPSTIAPINEQERQS